MSDEWLADLGLVSGDGAFYEDWRQEELTVALGQVHCSVSDIPLLSGGRHQWPMDRPCTRCGAAV